MSGYRSDDDWSLGTDTDEEPKRRLSGWWVAIALAVGLPIAILVGRLSTDGAGEIAGIIAASLTFSMRAFWDFRVKPWFMPLVAGWVAIHLAIFAFVVLPMKIQASKALIYLIWVEFLGFAGLLWIASKLWGGLPDDGAVTESPVGDPNAPAAVSTEHPPLIESDEPHYGIARRIIVGIGAGLGLLALMPDLWDGAIDLHDDTITRAGNPVAFWLVTFFAFLAFGGALYWALWQARRRS